MDSGETEPDTPGGPRKWSDRARSSWKAWRNYYPSLAYARGDPRTFYVPIDREADIAGLSQHNFYERYLRSGRLPNVVKTWFHGRKRRQKSFVQRATLLELLTREMLEAARFQFLRCNRRQAISHRTTAADLERELELRLPRGSGSNKR